jgi:hypothetical protein
MSSAKDGDEGGGKDIDCFKKGRVHSPLGFSGFVHQVQGKTLPVVLKRLPKNPKKRKTRKLIN